jgi:hypothetical protein
MSTETDSPEYSILAAMSKMDGKSYFPDAPENQTNTDFQSGYERGLQGDGVSCAGIAEEWDRRGQPVITNDSFITWKRGYWAGRYTSVSRSNHEN